MKPSSFIDVATKAKTIISDFNNESDKKKFYSSCRKCCIAAVSFHLITKLYSQYLHPQKSNCSASTSAISNLCLNIVKVFGSKALKIFELPLDFTSYSIVDVVRTVNNIPHITVNVHGRK